MLTYYINRRYKLIATEQNILHCSCGNSKPKATLISNSLGLPHNISMMVTNIPHYICECGRNLQYRSLYDGSYQIAIGEILYKANKKIKHWTMDHMDYEDFKDLYLVSKTLDKDEILKRVRPVGK